MCNCMKCPNFIAASSVTVTDGVTTITVPASVSPVNGSTYCIGLFTTVPSGANGNSVVITNGTSTWTVYNRLANVWRPCCSIRQMNVIKLKYYDDPVHFLKV